MPIYTAEQLDLSRLPPLVLVNVDAEAEVAALKAGIVARYEARGIPYDVQSLETDFGMIAAEEFGYRKTLDLQALNDTGRRLTVTYGDGAALDHIAATYYADLGIRRLVLVPEDPVAGTAAVLESDARFKLRLSLAPEARSGALGAYEYEALTAAPFLYDALALNHASGLVRPGQILVVLYGRAPDPDPATAKPEEEEPAQIALATAAIRDRARVLASDEVLIRPVRRVPVERGYRLGLRRGPDPNLILAQARARYRAFTDPRPATPGERQIGKPLAESLEKRELAVPSVEYVHALPGSGDDVDPGIDGVIVVTRLDLPPETIGG